MGRGCHLCNNSFTVQERGVKLDLSHKATHTSSGAQPRTAIRAPAVRRNRIHQNPTESAPRLPSLSLLFSSYPLPLLLLPRSFFYFLSCFYSLIDCASPRSPQQDGYEPLNRVSHLHLLGTRVCAAGLELTPGSQRFNLISKSDIR